MNSVLKQLAKMDGLTVQEYRQEVAGETLETLLLEIEGSGIYILWGTFSRLDLETVITA